LLDSLFEQPAGRLLETHSTSISVRHNPQRTREGTPSSLFIGCGPPPPSNTNRWSRWWRWFGKSFKSRSRPFGLSIRRSSCRSCMPACNILYIYRVGS